MRISRYQPTTHFGGPDQPPRALRHLLEARIDAVPPGGSIRWATYYFRDERLAHKLVLAARRGVNVAIAVEGNPRRRYANDAVLAILRSGLPAESLHIAVPPLAALAKAFPHLHTKIYAFSHPSPSVLVGSFNPSGNDPEDADVIAEIGDQDRGHNMLVELTEPALVMGLVQHVEALFHARGGILGRCLPAENRVLHGETARAWFFPRLATGVLDREMIGSRFRGTISHLKSGQLAAKLVSAARAGAQVELLVHDTERRVPGKVVADMADAGVSIRRYAHPEALPLHTKFLIVEREGVRTVWFGSFNFNPRSRWLNHELLLCSTNRDLVAAMDARFDTILRETERWSAG